MKKITFFLSLAIGFSACSFNEDDFTSHLFINMDSIIHAQPANGVRIEKQASIGIDQSNGSVVITKNWETELAAFARIDVMNKPVYKNIYQLQSGSDPSSNLALKKLLSTDSIAPVRSLKLFSLPQENQIIRLEAELKESGLFYFKKEKLIMEFDPYTKRLERYSVNGQQQLGWFEPETYMVQGSVQYTQIP